MNDYFDSKPGAFESQHIKEIKLVKSKRREEELQKIIEKNRKKKSGLIGKLKGIEEKVEISKRLLFPYWLIKYTYPQKKGVFKKKMVDSENVMVVDGLYGNPCSNKTCKMALRRMTILAILLDMTKEEICITDKDGLVPPLTIDTAIETVSQQVSAALEHINNLLYDADTLGQQIAPDCMILDELKSRARYIRERINTLASERQTKAVFEVARGGFRTLTGGRAGLGDIKSGIKHGLWSGRSGGANPVENFIDQSLNPGDIQAMDEAELRNLLEEVSAIIHEYQTQLEPYLREVEGKRAEAYTAQENLRASTNLPKKAQSISNYLSGELIFFPYICVKYSGVDKKGKTYCRWLVLNGINGNLDKEMGNKIEQFISYLS